MAESIGIDSARLVLAHALLFTFGKASLGFFGVVDSVRFLDSEKLDSRFCFCESLDCESKLLKLDFKLSLDSESASDSALGLPSWRGFCGATNANKKISHCGGACGVFGGCGGRSYLEGSDYSPNSLAQSPPAPLPIPLTTTQQAL